MQKKLLLSYIVIGFIAIGISMLSFWNQGYQFISRQSEEYYLSQASMLADIFRESAFHSLEDYIAFSEFYGEKYQVRITIIDREGNVFADSKSDEQLEDHSNREEVKRALQGESVMIRRYSKTMGKDYSYSAVPVDNGDFTGVLRVSLPLEEFFSLYNSLVKSILYTFFACVIASIILAFVLSKVIAKPIYEVAKGADRISEGELDAKISKIYTRDKGEVGMLANAFNVMSQSLQETIQNLKSRNVELEAMLSSMSAGIIAINDDNEILFCNDNIFNFTKREKSELKGLPLYSVIRNQAVILTVEEVREQRTRLVKESYDSKMDNMQIRIIGCPLTLEEESFGVLLIIEDITKMKKLESIRSDFVSNVTHELKTPLTSIRGFIETLKAGAIKDEVTANRFLDIIDIEAERLFILIKDILLLSEIESRVEGERLPCDINQIVKDTIELLEPKLTQKVRFVFHDNPDIKPLYCNPHRIKQMFINLLDNAIMYTEEGTIQITCTQKLHELEIRIQDTGIGMNEEHLERIFERFYRVDRSRSRKNGGTGLGLSIVKHIVELYNGRIRVTSKFGEGTEFVIRFPYLNSSGEF